MASFIGGVVRIQAVVFPDPLEEQVSADVLVRVVDILVDEPDLPALGFVRVDPTKTRRPGYHPTVPLKLLFYNY